MLGPLWARRYDAEPVVDDEGCADRLGYLVDNPRQANLVADAEHWPGLNLAYGLGDSNELTFTYLDRTAWHRKKRPADLRPFLKQARLVLSALPGCEGMPPELYRESLRSWMEHSYAKAQARKRESQPDAQKRRARPLGVEAVVQTAFETRPNRPAFRRRPYAHGRADNVRAHNHATLTLLGGYAERAERYRGGEWDVEFPEGTYRPPLMRAA